MASVVSRPNGHKWIQFKRPDSKRATVRLGKCSKTVAESYCNKIERLLSLTLLDEPIDRDLVNWLKKLPAKLHKRIADQGLASVRDQSSLQALSDYFMKMQGTKKPGTIINYQLAITNLVGFFGADRDLRTISPGDADEFRSYLLTEGNRNDGKPLAGTTAQKRLQRIGTIFKTAVRKGWIEENPFSGVTVAHASPNVERIHYIDTDTTYQLLDACEHKQFKLLFALVRFGGLRHPSETLPITWSAVDWENDSITFRSPKTEHLPGKGSRTIPLFAELRPYFQEAWDALEPGASDLIFPDLNVEGYALSKRLNRLCRKVGIEAWPKPWVNLRSTRQTEIEELYGLKCACNWIGNTESVAKRHYLQVTKEHHARAISEGAGAKRPKKRSKKRSTI